MLAALVLIALVIGVGAFTVAHTTRVNLQAQLDAQLDSAGELVRSFDFDSQRPGGPNVSTEIHQLSTIYLGLIAADGSYETLFVPDYTDAEQALPVVNVDQARRAAGNDGTYTVQSTASGVRYRVHAIGIGHQEVVLVALPMDSVDNAVSHLIALELLVSGISGVVLLLVGWWVIHLGVRPLKSMASAASSIAAGDLSSRVPVAHPSTEAGELALALNTMLERIEVAFDERSAAQSRLQQFIADASHELRTPVATIRGYAELYRHGALDGVIERDDAMRRTEQEAVRMGSLVDDLLLLAKLDGQRPMATDPVDLAQLAADAARDAHAVDPTRLVRVIGDGPIVVCGDEDRLRQVLANVVTNALVHSPGGTPLEIVVLAAPGAESVALSIVDHGEGIPTELTERVFERFVRADASRSRDRGGSGLGLSIVHAIVMAHRGTVRIDPTPGGGATVTITLPLLVTSSRR
ncbi:MAG: histidine kinase [Ilumatobacteraceae bacterium]|nr:histidine kinase [Ilumatobacteraceae bacterium]